MGSFGMTIPAGLYNSDCSTSQNRVSYLSINCGINAKGPKCESVRSLPGRSSFLDDEVSSSASVLAPCIKEIGVYWLLYNVVGGLLLRCVVSGARLHVPPWHEPYREVAFSTVEISPNEANIRVLLLTVFYSHRISESEQIGCEGANICIVMESI
jgi:hypothetical protein